MHYNIFATGRRGAVACIEIDVNRLAVVATAEAERITEHQMLRALQHEFPRHTFVFHYRKRDSRIRADADRWTGDGIEEKDDD